MEARCVNVSQNKNVFDSRKMVDDFQSIEKFLIVTETGKFKRHGKHESLIKLMKELTNKDNWILSAGKCKMLRTDEV